jgi:hypothetical protein
MKTQDLNDMSYNLGLLAGSTEAVSKKLDHIMEHGLPSCQLHTKRMEAIEVKLEKIKTTTSSSDSFGYGKMKASGMAAVFGVIIIAVGAVAIGVIKILK